MGRSIEIIIGDVKADMRGLNDAPPPRNAAMWALIVKASRSLKTSVDPLQSLP
jgi:hypothetical protein